MTFRGIVTGLVALGYLTVSSEARTCRLPASASLSVSNTEATSTSSLPSTTLLDPTTSSVPSDSTTFAAKSSTTSLSNDESDTTTTVVTDTTVDATSATSGMIYTTTTMPTSTISDVATSKTELTVPTVVDKTTSTADVTTVVATSDLASATTTTAGLPMTPLTNIGFDDPSLGTDPWDFSGSDAQLDQTFYFSGRASLKINTDSGAIGQWAGVQQNINLNALEPDVDYYFYAYVYSKSGFISGVRKASCTDVIISCRYGDDYYSIGYKLRSLAQNYDEWYRVYTTCRFSQAQIDTREASVEIGFRMGAYPNGNCWIDPVVFGLAGTS